METYRILISDFDHDIRSIDVRWIGRQFRLDRITANDAVVDTMHTYLSALADNTRKPLITCMDLAAVYAFSLASIEVMTPEQVAKADESSAAE